MAETKTAGNGGDLDPDARAQLIYRVFSAACELPEDQRESNLDASCAGDSSLRNAVEDLLRDYDRETLTSFPVDLGTWGGDKETDDADLTRLPERIGPYRILRRVGRGGMGEVFLAEELRPPRRLVALKILHRENSSPRALRRLVTEAELLARLQHPNIAKIFEVRRWKVEGGWRPYFSMEYIEGQGLREYLQVGRLSLRAKLELLVRICDAVQHAHERGVLHRDLKPENILIDSRGEPKILDFGIATSIADDQDGAAEPGERKEPPVLVGTPEYMSPEQTRLKGGDLDTRSDVYTLGVIGYEMLVGGFPYEVKSSLSNCLRAIREVPPAPLGTRDRTLRGDLETIFEKALEKNREHRYFTAAAFAEDLRRFLAFRPIRAREPSRSYRFQKFLRRNVRPVAAVLIVIISLAGGLGRALVERNRAQGARADAEQDAKRVALLNQFLRLLFRPLERHRSGPGTRFSEAIDLVVPRIPEFFAGEPLLEADACSILGDAYFFAGLYEKAEGLQRRAYEIRRHERDAEDIETVSVLESLAVTIRELGRLEEAEQLMRRTGDVFAQQLEDDDIRVLRSQGNLAQTLILLGRYAEAEDTFREVLAIQQEVFGLEHLDTQTTLDGLAQAIHLQKRFDEAAELLRELRDLQIELYGRDSVDTLTTTDSLASVLRNQGKLQDAESLREGLVTSLQEVLGRDHPRVAIAISNLGNLRYGQKRLAEAEGLFREALDIHRRIYGRDHFETLITATNLAGVLLDEGTLREAERHLLEVLDRGRLTVGAQHPDFRIAQDILLDTLRRRASEEPTENGVSVLECLVDGRRPSVPTEAIRDLIARLERDGAASVRAGEFEDGILMLREAREVRHRLNWVEETAAETNRSLLERVEQVTSSSEIGKAPATQH